MSGAAKNKYVRGAVKSSVKARVSAAYDGKKLSYCWSSVLTLFLVFYFEAVYISKEMFL